MYCQVFFFYFSNKNYCLKRKILQAGFFLKKLIHSMKKRGLFPVSPFNRPLPAGKNDLSGAGRKLHLLKHGESEKVSKKVQLADTLRFVHPTPLSLKI
jgi:hypothetical protein